ncbi:Nucleotide pyrophosphatase/phosphodiesterase [Zea mays]|uniref:Nucleotide pyrophosphatase/phosphodiesterase n=1 Tax=Zea mays TaxID=4577 RepID=A0A1D6KE99_MAIZE|nr:Nucleotide pyrophosphatase/phosphodiesterase [Zea mays]
MNGTRVWSKSYSFRASPYPGQDSLQRVVIFGDMGKAEADGSNEFNNFQPGSLNTTYQITSDIENIDMVVHIGDICYANGYLSQWDQFTAQIEPIASTVTTRGIGLAPVHSTATSTPAENAASLPKPCSTLRLRTAQSSGTQRTTACSGSASLTRRRTGGPGPSSTGSSSGACRPSTGRSSRGSSSSRTASLGTRPAPTTSRRARSRSPWGGKRCRSSGRSTRSTSPSMDTSTATRGRAQSTRASASSTRRTTTAGRSRRRRTSWSAAREPASRSSPPRRSSGATSPTSTTASSSSPPSTTRRCCSSTRRAATATCTTVSPSRATTGTSSLAPSTTAPGPHWPHEASRSRWFSLFSFSFFGSAPINEAFSLLPPLPACETMLFYP